jgi:phospholipase C
VIIFQENRTPDNLFHGLPGADIANSGTNSAGQTIALTSIGLANDYDLSHAHSAFVAMYDGGKMDGADKIPISCQSGATDCPPANPQFRYVDPADVQPYFQMAEQYTFADRMFQRGRAFLRISSSFQGLLHPQRQATSSLQKT